MSTKNSAQKKRVLVVDDQASTAECICAILKSVGIHTSWASNSAEALHSLKEFSPHALLLDINLAYENGLDLLVKLKEVSPSVPIVMLTAIGYDDLVIKAAIQNGASGYFSKDSGLENVVPVLEHLIDKSYKPQEIQ